MSVLVPTSLADALSALESLPNATVVAGGTDVMVEVNERRRTVSDVVVVNRVAELRSWSHEPAAGTLRIGAGVTWAELEAAPFTDWVPSLAQAARTVGSPQIRHAGTIGGNLGTCSPAGDGLVPLAALAAEVHLASARGERTLPFAEFMTGPKRTALAQGELVVAVTVPLLRGFQGYAKVGVRNAMVISAAGVALVVDEEARSIRLALGAVGPVMLRCPHAEELVAGSADWERRAVTSDTTAMFAALARDAARPIDDHRSTADYRRHAVGVLAARLLRRAFPNG